MDSVVTEPHITELLEYSGNKKVAMISQTEAAECGVACLAMVSTYYGHKLDLPAARKFHTPGLKGINVQQLIQTADKMQLAARALKCPLEHIGKLTLPCVLHWDLNHFVVLTGVKKNKLTINDPATGTRVLTLDDFSKHYTGIAIELIPTKKFEKKDSRQKMGIRQLWTRISGLGKALITLVMLSILLQIFMLLSPYYIQLVVDEVLISFDTSLLVVLASGFSLLLFFNIITKAIRSWLILRLSSQLSLQMGANLLRHLLRLPMSYFETRHIGDLVSRFGSLGQVRERMTTGLVETIVDGIMSIAILGVMLTYSPFLTGVVLCIIAMYLLIRLALYNTLQQATEVSIEAKAKEQSQFLETARGIQTIRLFNAESMRQSNWQNRYSAVINADIKLGKLNIGFESANQFLFGLENIFIIFLAATAVMDGELTIGMLFAFLAYKEQLTTRMSVLIEQIVQFKMLRLHLDRIADIALHEQEPHREKGRKQIQMRGNIKLVDLSFKYSPDDEYVFKNINLEVRAGESVALVGPSGCGKSTLLKIMLGLLQPTSGKVLVDGEDIRDLGLSSYRDYIGSVMQDDTLLTGTIEENISFFDPEPDHQLLAHCAYLAGIHKDILNLPMNYQSLVSDMGSNFSGGQTQRLLLARALYRRPVILFLDEATSHLDVENENRINENIKTLPVTRLMIAHRPETIESADRVVNLADL
ncbi:peptidase domain-containing ABC transporter [Vibrio caribbeanicus]|uniref:Putative toxin secretion ABC transporter, ATP-binding subunit n=1 Tax=Vibrio caribbeanicus ATCC BAA-2122 TaxID=796620 RepID=E3BFY6_9VIBR|nr:peptidase domain-containing ABC transporter [Vibrio caribbeanicus]EFP98010.1 putative toxin secretion ABC transporter, ATP-binding subunit [Vibrio caribbeanicus ATCC BAA-2122]